MSKSSKPTILLILLLLVIVTAFALASVSIKLKYEQALLLKDDAQKKFKTESQRKIKLTAEQQTFSSEDRIVKIANTEIGLIRDLEAPVIIKYDQSKVDEIDRELKEKYD